MQTAEQLAPGQVYRCITPTWVGCTWFEPGAKLMILSHELRRMGRRRRFAVISFLRGTGIDRTKITRGSYQWRWAGIFERVRAER